MYKRQTAEFAVGFHGSGHSIRQKEGSGILQYPVGFRLIVNQDFTVMIQNLGEKYRPGINSLVGNGCIGRSQLQIGGAVGQAAKSLGGCLLYTSK